MAQLVLGRWLGCCQVLPLGDLPALDPPGFPRTLLRSGLSVVYMTSLGRRTVTPATQVQNAGAKTKDNKIKAWDELQYVFSALLTMFITNLPLHAHHKLLFYCWASLLNETSVFCPFLPCMENFCPSICKSGTDLLSSTASISWVRVILFQQGDN